MKLFELITADNWFKGAPGFDAHGRACLARHFHLVYRPETTPRSMSTIGCALRDAALALCPERFNPLAVDWVAQFNDHPDTTVDDVIRVCKVADV